MDAILTIRNKGSEYRLLLPKTTPQQLCSLVWHAVEDEGHVLVNDMGRLAMHIIHRAVAIAGSRLLGGPKLEPHLEPRVSALYDIDRPARSLRLKMRGVFTENKRRVLHDIYDGLFSDYKKYLPTILANKS